MKLAGVAAKQKKKFKATTDSSHDLPLAPNLLEMSNRLKKELVINALRMAIWRRRPRPGLIFHSDRGSQYCSNDFQKMLKENDMISSMSGKGDCGDNSVAKYSTREEARLDIVDYIEMFYNNKRRHSYLGYLSPKEFEKMMTIKKTA
eukprot:CAMPEP_0201282174 /NCGR_PEP_ID=MMETSP1317-20130820/5005_1 /ASSEMBLY_ACC=CAM_ASM_000770 /TAXON_ID=187299 /ORGANISM="Undescribed Undescribed, Strain Undescribed" /LENGTH=146 /DNA_ID=CAMNT_0047594151 /DNA_START=1772 /DNA_END=2212 /DNA_ORIENTATION=+